ncbi:MAG: hypothetical protein Q4E35_02885 [Eubacteriales bacterium]|nr:hypothetical protein [Eubacteriales bacterium]
MKTNEETKVLKEEQLEQVSGGDVDGDIEITFESIMQYIEAGNERMAANLFELVHYSLAPLDAYTIKMTFWAKFGYPIEMYGG